MKLTEYVPLAIRTEKPLPKIDRLIHGCMGLITEIGEVTTELKRMAIYGKELDSGRKAHILEEVGDVMWYVAIMLDTIHADLGYVQLAPQMEMPSGEEGRYEAMAMMLGVHCGRVCYRTQSFAMEGYVDESSLPGYLASLAMIINGMYVLSLFCDSTLNKAMADNIAKLRIRYPATYSNEAAEGRADKAGADARVS